MGSPDAYVQFSLANRSGTRSLLNTINRTLGDNALPDQRLNDIFEVWWPRLEEQLNEIPPAAEHSRTRTDRELLEELLSLARSQTIRTARNEAEGAGGIDINENAESVQKSQLSDERGPYRLESLTTPGARARTTYEWHGFLPPEGRSWRYDADRLEQLAEDGRIVFPKNNGYPRLKRYLAEMTHKGPTSTT